MTDRFPLRWEHPVKKRYYRVTLQTDLLGDCVLTKIWGSTGRRNGRIVHVLCESTAAGERLIRKIARIRKNRGYMLCEGSADAELSKESP